MKLHTQPTDHDELMALHDKVHTALNNVNFDRSYGSNIVALDGDFLPTNNINDARWLYSTNHYDYAIVRINADGSMTQMERD
jgi:hypothetical protein